MYYNLFLDDERLPKDVTWVDLPLVEWTIVRNYNQFIKIIMERGMPSHISFDHDLGDEHYKEYHNAVSQDRTFDYTKCSEPTGYDCVKWLVEYCITNNLDFPSHSIHTMNNIGADNIKNYIQNYERHRHGS